MTTFSTLDAWLAHLEAAHPVGIDMGLTRIGQVKDALGLSLRLPGHHGRRHERQGLDLRDSRNDPAARRLSRGLSHVAASAGVQRARAHQRRRCQRRRTARTLRSGRKGAHEPRRAGLADVLRIHDARDPASLRVARAGRGDSRSRPGRAARRGQHHRYGLRDHHQHRHRSHRLSRRYAREDRLREGRHFPRGQAGRSAAIRSPPQSADRPRGSDRRGSVARRPRFSLRSAAGQRAPAMELYRARRSGARRSPIRRCAARIS